MPRGKGAAREPAILTELGKSVIRQALSAAKGIRNGEEQRWGDGLKQFVPLCRLAAHSRQQSEPSKDHYDPGRHRFFGQSCQHPIP